MMENLAEYARQYANDIVDADRDHVAAGFDSRLESRIASAIVASVQAEQRRCAKVAREQGVLINPMMMGHGGVGRYIADVIEGLEPPLAEKQRA